MRPEPMQTDLTKRNTLFCVARGLIQNANGAVDLRICDGKPFVVKRQETAKKPLNSISRRNFW